MNVHVRRLSPPLEHAPDQIASRPFDTLSVIDVPVVNDADPVLPTDTLIPAGFERTRSPLRPVAVTVSVADEPCGFTVTVAVRVTPLKTAEIATGVDAATDAVEAANVAFVAPPATVTLGGTCTAAALALDRAITAPPAGAAAVSVTVPVAAVPPVTAEGLNAIAESDAAAAADCGVNRRTDENRPNTPAELRARTRHQSRCAGRPPRVALEAVVVMLETNGAPKVDELST